MYYHFFPHINSSTISLLEKSCRCFVLLISLVLSSATSLLHVINEWSLQRGVELFLRWAIMQGVAMILHNRYQRQRLYTRIALGKVKSFPLRIVTMPFSLSSKILNSSFLLPSYLFVLSFVFSLHPEQIINTCFFQTFLTNHQSSYVTYFFTSILAKILLIFFTYALCLTSQEKLEAFSFSGNMWSSAKLFVM